MSASYLARFCYHNVLTLSGVAITSSSQSTSLPDDNVINALRTKVWEATGKNDEYVQFNLPSVKKVQQVAIINHNFTAGATVTILAATNSDFSPTAVTTAALTVNTEFGLALHSFATEQTYQYWRIRVQDSGNSNSVQIGFASMGPYTELDYRPGFRLRVVDPSRVVHSMDGQKAIFSRTKYKMVEFLIGDAQDVEDLEDIITEVGIGKDFVLILDPNNNKFDNITDGLWRFTLYGTLAGWDMSHRMKGVFNVSAVFEEAR
jgi:hypothetical protein